MAALVVILSLLSFPAATGYKSGVLCTQCVSESLGCQGPLVPCPLGLVCGSQYIGNVSASGTVISLVRTCTHLSQCGFTGSKITLNGHTREIITCCSNDGCTPDRKKFLDATKDPPKNGLMCQVYSPDDSPCYPSTFVKCRAYENMCFLQNITNITGNVSISFSAEGCTTQSYCDRGNLTMDIGGTLYKEDIICTKAINKYSLVKYEL